MYDFFKGICWMKDKLTLCFLAFFIGFLFIVGLPFLDGLFGQDKRFFYLLLSSVGFVCSFVCVYLDYRHSKNSEYF